MRLLGNPETGMRHDRSSQRAEFLRPVWARFGCLVLSLQLVGCAEEQGVPKFPVTGKVTIDGKPLETGSISFLPAAAGPAASARIEEGTFALDRAEGPGQGSYKVEIISIQSTGKQIPSPDDPSLEIEETRNIIPTRYNSLSQLMVQVKPDVDNAFQFEISSREPKTRSQSRRRR